MKKALILAAGYGSRLEPITKTIPKALVKVNEVPIIFKQIENLKNNGITDITVVTGYKSDVLKETIFSQYSFVNFIDSVDYKTTNNMYSAFIARDHFENEPFLMMNADVFFDSSVIDELLCFNKENAIVVDTENYFEESMKVVEHNGHLVEISKDISKNNALGSSIDVYKFSAEAGAAFFEKCSNYINNKGELKLWSEVALNDVLKEENELFYACRVNGRWIEIDNFDDLNKANSLFAED